MSIHETIPTDRAIVTLLEAAEAGAADAARELAERHRTGRGVAKSDALALHWCSVGAELGDAAAQNDLGSMLLNGIGCAADAEAAVFCFRASAGQGHPVAQFNLGLRYLHGDGAEPDDQSAFDWIARSAAQGYVDAVGELGTLFRFGRGTGADLLQAAQLHIAAARAGDVTSHGNLAGYRGQLVDLAMAGSREAAFDLCVMHDQGLGGPKDPALCWGWIHWAHEKCLPAAESPACTEALESNVRAAFACFGSALDHETRERGEASLRDLQKQKLEAGCPHRTQD